MLDHLNVMTRINNYSSSAICCLVFLVALAGCGINEPTPARFKSDTLEIYNSLHEITINAQTKLDLAEFTKKIEAIRPEYESYIEKYKSLQNDRSYQRYAGTLKAYRFIELSWDSLGEAEETWRRFPPQVGINIEALRSLAKVIEGSRDTSLGHLTEALKTAKKELDRSASR